MKKYSSDDLDYHIYGRGGSGKGATRKWEVFVKGKRNIVLASGETNGASQKAMVEIEEAKMNIVASGQQNEEA